MAAEGEKATTGSECAGERRLAPSQRSASVSADGKRQDAADHAKNVAPRGEYSAGTQEAAPSSTPECPKRDGTCNPSTREEALGLEFQTIPDCRVSLGHMRSCPENKNKQHGNLPPQTTTVSSTSLGRGHWPCSVFLSASLRLLLLSSWGGYEDVTGCSFPGTRAEDPSQGSEAERSKASWQPWTA